MIQNKPRILIITSVNPTVGPGRLAIDAYNMYVEEGFEVDVLTLYEVEEYPNFIHVYSRGKKPFVNKFIDYIRVNILNKPPFFRVDPGQAFFYRFDEFPYVSNKKILSLIKKKYDIVSIQFTQGMLTMSSIEAIYDKLKCQIHISGVDYWQMSGGCHFIGNCEGYKTGCKECKSVKPKWCNNFASHNVQLRKRIYAKVNPIIWGNTYMMGFYKNSYLLKNLRLELSGCTIDLKTQFIVRDTKCAREELGIPDNKNFVISFGCQSLDDPRKGIKYLIEALNIFYNALSYSQRCEIAILTSGNGSKQLKDLIPFDSYHLGFVSINTLSKMYSASDIFLCSSVNDAGPMMVNQSLCCGTPVVAFEMGAALDCVKGKGTGYCAPLIDVQRFSENIMKIYKQTPEEKRKMRNTARQFAEKNFSKQSRIANLLRVYNKYREK